LQIVVCSFQQFVVVGPALAFAPFGIPATVFWIYVCALALFIIGLIKIFGELRQEHGIDKIMPFGRLFFAIPLAVFGSEHFTLTANIATLVPRWIPAPTFWVYLVGLAFLGAALSIAVLVKERLARLAAALVGMTLLIFVFVMDLPAVVANPGNRFFWALALRQLAFSGGAFAFAMCPRSTRPRQSSPALRTAATAGWPAIPRFFVGLPSLFYGVEHLLHPEYVPGVPLQKLTPEWIPGRILLSYFVGVILILAGVCLLVNKKARTAATSLGLTILLTVLWIYLPMLLAAPTDVVALNFFFDTLLFSGAILLLANSIDKEPTVEPAATPGR
jgi:uncharacterized membrane protein